MSAMSRRKGAGYEREIVKIIRESLGIEVKRNLDQVRDGGGDIVLGKYLIECKRRKSIAVYEWLDQCIAACMNKFKPLVVVRGDNRENLVILRLTDFLEIIKEKPLDSMESSSSQDGQG